MRELMGESAAQVVDINTFIASIGDAMQQISANDEVTRATEESHAVLDVSGINYGALALRARPRAVPQPDHRRQRDLPRATSTSCGGSSGRTRT